MNNIQKTISDIKSLRIQGATNIALSAAKVYASNPSKKLKKTLISSRPTEPALFNILNQIDQGHTLNEIIFHLEVCQNTINQLIYKLVKNNSTIYTHCHSSTVVKALISLKKKGRRFQVNNTETRPMLQGQKTAKELAKHNIKVNFFVDSAFNETIKSSDLIFLGADAILNLGVLNKIGSATIAHLAKLHKKPVYILANSWKYYSKNIKIEERNSDEVWKNPPKKVNVRNPAFDTIQLSEITRIISELGILKPKLFLKKAFKLQN